MDNLTHSLVGLTLARTPLGKDRPGATAALVLASNAPDIDIVSIAGDTASYLEWHRGPTHGLLGIAALGLLSAGIVWLFTRQRPAGSPARRFVSLWMLGTVGVAGHVLMDLPTVYGTRLLSPWSWTWWSVDWMPIVDIYLLAVLAAGLWLGRMKPAQRTRAAVAALALMLVDYGLRASLHAAALQRAPALFGEGWRSACEPADRPWLSLERWPRNGATPSRGHGGPSCLMDVAAMPDFVSPFRWRVIARFSDAYEVRVMELGKPGAGTPAPRAPLLRVDDPWTPMIARASATRVAQVFLGFSRFPAVVTVIEPGGRTRVRWTDLRFLPAAFRTTVEFAPDGTLMGERLEP